jgi:hypothetical protein
MISVPIILLVALIAALVAVCIANRNKQGKIYKFEAEKRELEAEKSKVRELHTSLLDKERFLEGDKMHFERVGNGLLASLNVLYTKSNTLSEALNRITALVGADPYDYNATDTPNIATKKPRQYRGRTSTLITKLSATTASVNEQFEIQIKCAKTLIDLAELLKEQLAAMPWISKMMSDLLINEYHNVASYLTYKDHPAPATAKRIQQAITFDIKQRMEELHLLRYKINAYEALFPWLLDYTELTDEDIKSVTNARTSDTDGSGDGEYENLKSWLSPDEYYNLSSIERYQLALDRYASSHKSNWQIGIAYERYVGYQYESKGYRVTYTGATEGLMDKGRDLIARRGDDIIVIQCKRWSINKTIHEKHIFQLFGTVTEYRIKERDTIFDNVKGLLVTTTVVSPFARECAELLGITIREKYAFDKDYPMIKCNCSRVDSEKIYHLPFDQQYDRVVIEPERGERFVKTVAEAERLGFRRAKRYLP